MAGEIKASPRLGLMGLLADALKGAQSGMNRVDLPYVGGMGDLMLGGAPQLADDISYQGLSALVRGGNAATGGIGTYGLKPEAVDLAGVMTGLGGIARPAVNAAGRAALPVAREFVETVGARNMSRMPMAKGQTGVIKVVFKEDPKAYAPKIQVNDDGTVEIYKQGSGFESYADFRDDVFSAVREKFSPQYDHYFRFTNNKDEISLAKQGILNPSRNHAEGFTEKGLSVADGPHYGIQGYKYGYPVYGKHVGWGSDGEPLLDPKSLEVLTDKLLKAEEIVKFDRLKQAEILKNAGLPPDYFSNIVFENDMYNFKTRGNK